MAGTQMAAPTGELSALIRDLLRSRGLEQPEAVGRFMRPNYERDLGDPFLLTDMAQAIERLRQAIQSGEKVAIYGDYDIDGIVSTALMLEVLQQHGLDPISYIPDRYEEGYGVNQSALAGLKKQGVSLVLTVDCGITSVVEATWAAKNGLDLIITDHHELADELPQAIAVINPHRPGDKYPFKELSGAGVAFALVRALQSQTGVPEPGKEKWLLDLVALGTICDVMPLVGENRVLARYGLIVLAKTRRPGLVALAQSAGIDIAQTKTYHLGFVFGPRLNAAGRLEHADLSLQLMMAKDPIAAQEMAFKLEELNSRRQMEQGRIMTEAEAQAEAWRDHSVLVLADPGWPHGVVGIVASKLADKLAKPVLVGQILGDDIKGSGRSARGYDLIGGLRSAEELFGKLGGHQFAAGFTLPVANLEALRLALNEHYDSVAEGLPPRPTREAEVVVDDMGLVNWDLYNELEQLEPFGNGNPQPTFGADGLKVIEEQKVGKDQQHLKLKLASPDGLIFSGIGFNLAEKYPNLKPGQIVDVIFFIEKNQWQDRSSLQLVLLAIQ